MCTAIGLVFLSSTAFAVPKLFGFLDINAAPKAVFGSINPDTGVFTQIGGATNLTGNEGHVPVYNPAANAFFVPTAAPPRSFGNSLERIDAATGATTGIVLQNILGSPPLILGLGVNSSSGQLVALADINAAPNAVFGSINPGTGVFTQIGGATNLTGNDGHVPVYNPAANAFFVPKASPPRNFSNTLERIDAETGATTEIVLQNILGPRP